MSMEIHLFFRGELPTKTALSRAMKELGFPFSIKPATGSLERQSGFMPMMLRGEETGVEFDVYNDSAAFAEFAAKGVDPSLERRASLRWGGDADETAAGLCVAAALAKLMNGAVLDEAENKLLSVDDAIAVARQNLKALVQPEADKQGGTRPANIKRYLKPLLKQRSDLALVGRMLIIRPVRHLLRGVFFDRTGSKSAFKIWRFVKPLYESTESIGYADDIPTPAYQVWHSHFEPLLFDLLAEDIFDRVGRITTYDELAHEFKEGHESYNGIRMLAFLFSGQRESASEVLDEIERSDPSPLRKSWAKWHKKLLNRDMDAIYATFHTYEAASAKKLKLGDIWEPTPFAGEVPEAQRKTRCAEPFFTTSPWIARPPGLVQEVPEHPGEIRFADDTVWRKGRVVMLAALTHDQAEERHRTGQSYSLATRLPGGNLLLFRYYSGRSPHDPHETNSNYLPGRDFRLEVYGSMGFLQSYFAEDLERRGVMQMKRASVYVHRTTPTHFLAQPVKSLWEAHNRFEHGTKDISDYRAGPRRYASRPMSDSDFSFFEFAEPPFGEFGDYWRRVSTYLENEGFGSFA
jgi:hypothetical protein